MTDSRRSIWEPPTYRPGPPSPTIVAPARAASPGGASLTGRKGQPMTDSTTPPSPDKSLGKTLFTVRYVIPAVFALVGLVSLFVLSSPLSVEAWALFTGAGLSV